ncbi:uncharacterized protein LOC117214543 [Bombus bifarius]|uniref:Odorant receptor n=1 Tax=Bombus bifarius TaxID=103933 RepID=A0A6P8MRZ6_9HYME|nr:uncharacterized protein LOC117156409 [Bombus vancouverensis nearcticus]XP_033316616.1 uncharacterized protein LOC117214543 [Bombus bifarius]
MDFRDLNPFNIFLSTLSANVLPMSSRETKLPIFFKIYSIIIWLIEVTYFIACVVGILTVSREKALKDGTVNLVIAIEVLVLMIYMHNRKNLLRGLIGKLNHLIEDNKILRNMIVSALEPMEKPLKIYTVASVGSLALWISLPLIEVFRKNEFRYSDYRVPFVLSKEPFPLNVFVGGVIFQIVGGTYTLIRKISLDIYTMYIILLTTAQYKYLRMKFATIFEQKPETLNGSYNDIIRQNVSFRNERMIQEMRLLTRHYETVVEIAVMLKKLLFLNVGVHYINNVFRFCFLSFMFVMSTNMFSERCLVILYTIGALIQFYILCYCIQELLDASNAVADDVIYEKWYLHDVPLQRALLMVISANKLECKLSNSRHIDLTLSSFMSILNQAYSVCLLFLKSRPD